QNQKFRLVATMTGMSKSSRPWEGETGLINESLVKKVSGDLAGPIYYLAGPPAMVEAMRQTLNQANIDDDDIRSEEFFGY
ncbi:MAG: oxidoreductase, partial [Burkholderiales bacterium]